MIFPTGQEDHPIQVDRGSSSGPAAVQGHIIRKNTRNIDGESWKTFIFLTCSTNIEVFLLFLFCSDVVNSFRKSATITHTNSSRRIFPRYREVPISISENPIFRYIYIYIYISFSIFSHIFLRKTHRVLAILPPPPGGRRRRRRRRRKNFPAQPDPIPSRRDNISRSGPAPHSDVVLRNIPSTLTWQFPTCGADSQAFLKKLYH